MMPVEFCQISSARRINLMKFGLNMLYRRLTPWSWPIHMQIELTNYCELKCPVCPTGMGSRRPPLAMSPHLFEGLMNEAGPYLLTASLWGWGEPLLHPQLAEILRIASKHNVATLLSTNGQKLANEDVLDALIRYPPTYLIVAMDGLTDESNSVYRVGAKMAPVLEGVRRLAAMKRQKGSKLPILHWRYIAMKHNEHELPRLEQFAAENHFELLTIRTLSSIGSTAETHEQMVPNSDDLKAYGYEGEERIRRSDFICQYAFCFPAVLADGTVVTCDQDFNTLQPYGTLSEDNSFAETWSGEPAARARRAVKCNPEKLSYCRGCPYMDRKDTALSVQAFDLRPKEERFIPRIG
jgi:MoaA/NifB/PqqE/SkfB family radical SAM enzyme